MEQKSFSPNENEINFVFQSNEIKADKSTLQWFSCLICFQLVYNPKICDKCGSIYCFDCIQKWIRDNPNGYNCTLKCKNSTLRNISTIEKKSIDRINLKCKHKGCGQFINYTDYVSHFENCKFRLYHCNNKHCKKEGFFDELKEHSKNCNYRTCFCSLCNEKLIYNNVRAHWDQDCPQVYVSCIFCDAEMKRVDYLKYHKAEDANCLKIILKDKNEKLIEYDNLLKKMKTKIREQRKIIEENENTMKEQQNEISKLQNYSNILQKKNEEGKKK
jgi:hypothetical protein